MTFILSRFFKYPVFLALAITCVSLLIPLSLALAIDNSSIKKKFRHLHLVWSDDIGNGEQVFFSSHNDRGWTAPVQISDHDSHLFHPTSTIDGDGTIWVVWSQADANKTSLYYTRYAKDIWSKPQRLETGMSDNRSATIITNGIGNPIIVWSAIRRSYADIFLSQWDGKSWSKPALLHEENNVPDIDPQLVKDETGQVTLTYSTFSEGKYSQVTRVFSELTHSMMDPKGMRQMPSISPQERKELPDLPLFFTAEPHRAKLFIQSETGSRSIPLDRL